MSLVLPYDLHIHSCLSPCGENEMTPNNIVGMAQLMELSVIAVADHNTARNLPAILSLAADWGILAVPAMEITTAEEVHVLSLFPDLQAALSMGEELYEILPDVKNVVDIFGEQLILNEQDEVIGSLEKLLINAVPLSIEMVFEKVRSYGGVPIPAHIDKSSYSVLSNLGFLPQELKARTVEIAHPPFQGWEDYRVLTDSDAHCLEVFGSHEARTMELPERTSAAVLEWARNGI